MTESILTLIALLCTNPDFSIQRQCQRDLLKCIEREHPRQANGVYAPDMVECLKKGGEFK